MEVFNEVKSILQNVDLPPTYATPGSAGMDLRANIKEGLILDPGKRVLISTGVNINIPEYRLEYYFPSNPESNSSPLDLIRHSIHPLNVGIYAFIASRSSLSLKHGISVAQGIGVIDSDYQGEIQVILINLGESSYEIQPHEKIAQLIFSFYLKVRLSEALEFDVKTERGNGGFGSSGKF